MLFKLLPAASTDARRGAEKAVVRAAVRDFENRPQQQGCCLGGGGTPAHVLRAATAQSKPRHLMLNLQAFYSYKLR